MVDAPTNPSEQLHLEWEARIRVLTNSHVWKPILLAFGIPSVLLGIFFAFISGKAEYALLVPLVALGVLLTLFVLIALVIDVFGGFKCHFFLTTLGVRSVSGRGARAASQAAILMGIFAGKPGAVGAGMLAESEQNVFIPWKAVTKIKVKGRYIHIKREWGFKPIGLYCTADNAKQAIEILRYYAPDKFA